MSRTPKSRKPTAPHKDDLPKIQKNAMEAIEEWVCWHTAGVTAVSRVTGFPEIGTVTGIRWKNRTFLLTADHVIRDYADNDLRFLFRPPGQLDRNPWWQSSNPNQKLFAAVSLDILRRFRNEQDDLAALEVSAT